MSTGESRAELGREGEEMAARFYAESGCEILARNYRIRGGEIDIIARDGGEIAFIEVKRRKNGAFGAPAEAVDANKRRRICRAALRYAVENGLTEAALRFDVVEIQGGRMHVIKNAFSYVE